MARIFTWHPIVDFWLKSHPRTLLFTIVCFFVPIFLPKLFTISLLMMWCRHDVPTRRGISIQNWKCRIPSCKPPHFGKFNTGGRSGVQCPLMLNVFSGPPRFNFSGRVGTMRIVRIIIQKYSSKTSFWNLYLLPRSQNRFLKFPPLSRGLRGGSRVYGYVHHARHVRKTHAQSLSPQNHILKFRPRPVSLYVRQGVRMSELRV